MGCFRIALLSLAVFASCNAIHTYLPTDKELVYHYHATMTAGTALPKLHNSAFVLHGNLHVQNNNNSTFIKFTDMKYKLSNGEYDEYEEFNGKMMPLPKELVDLEKTFRVVHDTSGKVMGISTEPEELPYVVNIKKATAAIFQLDMEKIPAALKKPTSFHTNENSVYGMGKVYYVVRPMEESMLIEKMQVPHSTQHLYTHTLTNIEYDHCHAHYDEPISRDSQVSYVVQKIENEIVLTNIAATSGIYYQPYEGQSDAFGIYVNQTMELISHEPIKTKLTLTSEKYYDDLTYYAADLHDITGPIPDHTNGRHHWDEEKLFKQAEEMMTDITKYLEEDHINSKQPDVKRGQMMNHMVRILSYFDLEHFKKFHQSLLEHKSSKWYVAIYYEILPHIGTHASSYHIKHLIENKKVKDDEAVDLVQKMFSNVKFPNKMLVDDMSQMLSWGDDIDKFVRKAAILSFSTLLHKANIRHKRYNHEIKWYGHKHDMTKDFVPDLHLNEDFPDEKYYQKYIDGFIKQLKSATDDGSKILYMEALGNTRMTSVVDILKMIIKGEMWEDNFLRMMAALIISPMVIHDEDQTYELYWPLMIDPKLTTGLRIVSYYIIMKSEPTLSRLINLEWELQSTRNNELYQFHYRYLEAIAKTSDPCKQNFKVHVNQALRYVVPPEFHGLTGYYQIDYTDEKYGFGELFNGYLIHDKEDNEIILRVAYQHHSQKLSMTPQWMFVRIAGMEHSFLKDIKLDLKSTTAMFDFDELTKMLKTFPNTKDLQITIVFGEYNQVVTSLHYDNSNMDDLWEELIFLQVNAFSFSEKMISFEPRFTGIMMPTEMGFPAVFQNFIPDVHYMNLNFAKDVTDKKRSYQIDTTYKQWLHSRHGLTFYNPIADVWQGVNRYHSNNIEFNMLFNIQINLQQQSMKMTWKRHNEDGKSDMIGTKSHTMTMVSVRDDNESGVLQESSPKSKNFEIVSWGDQYRHDYLMQDIEESNIGYHVIAKVFDSERYVSNSTDNIDIDDLSKLSKQNFYTGLGQIFLTMAHYEQIEELEPEPTMNGVMYRIETMKNSSVSEFELAMRYNSEYKKNEDFMLPAAKHNVRLTVSKRNTDSTSLTVDLNIIVDNSADNKHNKIKIAVTRIATDEPELKMCLFMDENREAERATFDFGLSTNVLGEGTCTMDDSVLNITTVVERTKEQDDQKHIYSSCHKLIWADIRNQQQLKCYEEHASPRKYTFIVNTQLPDDQKTMYVENIIEAVKNEFNSFLVVEKITKEMTSDFMMVLELPTTGEAVNVKLVGSEREQVYEGIPSDKWSVVDEGISNTEYNRLYKFMHFTGLTNICLVQTYMVTNIHGDDVGADMPKEWTMYFSHAEKDSKHGVWAKKMDDGHISIRLVFNTHSLEITTTERGYEFVIDGKKLESNTHHHSTEFVYFDWIKETNVVTIFSNNFESHILFDGHSVQMEYPQTNMQYFGHCFDEQK